VLNFSNSVFTSKSWYLVLLSTCLSTCVRVNEPKRGSGGMHCIMDHHVSGCEYFSRCLYVYSAASAKSR